MKIVVILGTRPEIIKMSPVIRELEIRQVAYIILHTGQHYSYNLDKVFFEQLKLPQAKYNLEVGSGSSGLFSLIPVTKAPSIIPSSSAKIRRVVTKPPEAESYLILGSVA